MERNTADLLERLKEPFAVKDVHWRVGSTNAKSNGGKPTKGIALAYIDARDVMKRLDDVVGPENWQNRYSHVTQKGLICDIGIRLNGEWIWKANGAGDTPVEAEKGSMSDAFKRSAVMWGIGRYLYMLDNTWVDLDERQRIKTPPVLPTWATPEGYRAALAKRKAA